MKIRRVEKTDTDLAEAPGSLLRREVNVNPKSLDHVR
jgi:hypothetical protein